MLGLLLHQHLSDGRQYVVKASGWEETPVPIYELGTAQGTVSWGEEPEAVGQRFLLQYSYYILLLNPSVAKVGESVLLAEGSRNLPSDEFPCIGNRVAIAGGIFSCQIAQASVGDDTYSIYERIS